MSNGKEVKEWKSKADEVVGECVDIANFAMMLADINTPK